MARLARAEARVPARTTPIPGLTHPNERMEKGALKTKTVTLERPGPYDVTTDQDPVDESVEISVPGGPIR